MQLVCVVGQSDGQFVLRTFDTIGWGASMEPALEREPSCTCRTYGFGIEGPLNSDGSSCFVVHYRSHEQTCGVDVSNLSRFLDANCACGYHERVLEHRGDLVFMKSQGGGLYVDCDEVDCTRVAGFVQAAIGSNRCAYRQTLFKSSWCGLL
jgi:hypothetical protein